LLDRFQLLVSPNRAAAARQRSLEATVDWSYQLLSGSEQRVFRRLAVFPGPFTPDAAEAVAGTVAGPTVLRLVDCSLLLPPATGPDGRSRYLMLEMLRGYGLSRLREAGEEQDAAAALAAHALGVAERAAAQMAVRSGEFPAALWLDAEDAALHQGLAWLLDHDPASALRVAAVLAPWWLVRGRWIQGYALLDRAARQVSPGAGPWYAANVWLGLLASASFNNALAIGHCSTVIDALRDGPPSSDLVDALWARCSVLRNSAGLEEAGADARASLELARRIGYAAGEVMALAELGFVFAYAGENEQALEWARQVQRIDHDRMPGWRARYVERVLPYVMVMADTWTGRWSCASGGWRRPGPLAMSLSSQMRSS
jgi:tetratricopeptide (TPR) repeat protein